MFKEEITWYCKNCFELEQQLDQNKDRLKAKEQECERLKKRLNSQCFDPKNNNGRCISYNRMAEDYENDLRQLQAEKEKVNKYKQTLEEIKEIARKTLNMVDYKTYFKRDNKSIKQEGFKAIEQILQKCEVLDEKQIN